MIFRCRLGLWKGMGWGEFLYRYKGNKIKFLLKLLVGRDLLEEFLYVIFWLDYDFFCKCGVKLWGWMFILECINYCF